jgi:hypothetical protein
MSPTDIERVLQGLIDQNCVLLAINYDKKDGTLPSWRLIHSPLLKKGKRGLVLSAREENGNGRKTWNLDRITAISLPDSPHLNVESWFLQTPFKFDSPVATPLGGRVKSVHAYVDIGFQVKSYSLTLQSVSLTRSASILSSSVNVCSARRGEAWQANWRLSFTLNPHLSLAARNELHSNEMLRTAMWRRYAGWWRSTWNSQSVAQISSGIVASVFSWLRG